MIILIASKSIRFQNREWFIFNIKNTFSLEDIFLYSWPIGNVLGPETLSRLNNDGLLWNESLNNSDVEKLSMCETSENTYV